VYPSIGIAFTFAGASGSVQKYMFNFLIKKTFNGILNGT
jgi:hypothetical protein